MFFGQKNNTEYKQYHVWITFCKLVDKSKIHFAIFSTIFSKFIYIFLASILFLLLLTFDCVSSLYSPSDNIVELTSKQFKQTVLSDRKFWIIEFYYSGCKNCLQLVPEYKKLAKMPKIKGHIKVGAVDMAKDKEIAICYKVNRVPTILFFGANKAAIPRKYNGARKATAIAQAILAW